MKLVKEHINFERGLNPKDAMNIGDPIERVRLQIKNAITELAKKFDGYGVKDISTEGESIRYRFYIKYDTEEWVFYIMNELDEEFKEWACGWYRNWSENLGKPGKFGEEPEIYCTTLGECMQIISQRLQQYKIV